MRIHIAAAIAALVFAAWSAHAEPPAAAPAAPVLDFYPPAARAAGLEGHVTLRCARNAHLALQDCVVVAETPAGQGFGAAALAMAARSPDNPKLNVGEAALLAASTIAVHFRLHPPAIDPDLTQTAHVLKRPQVVRRPSATEQALYYPDRAQRARIGGAAQLHCHVTREGRLDKCNVVQETPPGADFGAAATAVAQREYRLSPPLFDGEPTDDAETDLSIAFGGGPAAPNPVAEAAARAAAADPTLIKRPDWITEPNGDTYGRVFPERAISHGVTLGGAVMDCRVRPDGRLDPCTVTSETPPGYGFGAAMLRIAVYFRMKPTDRDGAPTAGRHVLVPVRFEGGG